MKALVAGLIVRRDIHLGDAVSVPVTTDMFRLLPDRPRIVRAQLNEACVALIRPEIQAEVIPDTGVGRAIIARVHRVGRVFGLSRVADELSIAPAPTMSTAYSICRKTRVCGSLSACWCVFRAEPDLSVRTCSFARARIVTDGPACRKPQER